MTTGNRTNDPTEAQVEAAARAALRVLMEQWPEETQEGWSEEEMSEALELQRKAQRAALVAAHGAARPVNSFDTTAERVKTGADSLHVAPQEPNQNETKSAQNLVSLDPEKVAERMESYYDRWSGPGEESPTYRDFADDLCEAYTEGELT